MIPGEILPGDGEVPLNPGSARITVTVANTGDRPIQVGSHYHLAAANPALRFEPDVVWGYRLDIPAGTAVRFEPGVQREVSCVPIRGGRVVPGLRGELAGPLDRPDPRAGAARPGTAGGPVGGGHR